MYREAVTAQEVKTGIERSHHLTAALYFAVAALEAFINERTRLHLTGSKSEEEIFTTLRYGQLRGKKNENLIEKLKKWPEVITGQAMTLREQTLDSIELFNEVRGDLTHPKTHGHDIYRKLESVDPRSIVDVVAEYIAQFHKAENTRFPYWLWGWNYLNPSQQDHEIMLVNSQQFVWSMMYLGYNVQAGVPHESEGWQEKYMRDYAGYREVVDVLRALDYCEPKFDRFPYQPKLCRRWWTPEHHKSCGFVTREAIDYAINYTPES